MLEGTGGLAGDLRKAVLTSGKHRVTLPVSAYLIEHPKGLFLVDTGWSREISPGGVYDRKAVEKVLPAHIAALYHPYVPYGMTVTERLAEMGIKPEDLEAVLITHFDADHVSGLRSVSGARRIIVPEDEAYWSVRTKYTMRQVRDLWESVRYERLFFRGSPLGPMHKAVDVLGDGSLMMVSLPGHTDGQVGIMVRSGSKYALIAADAAYSRKNWEDMTATGFSADAELQKKTLRWIAETASDLECVCVLCSHEGEDGRVIEV